MPETTEDEVSPAEQRERNLKLLAWKLVFKVPMGHPIRYGHLAWGKQWLGLGDAEHLPNLRPEWWQGLLSARQRREDYAARHGRCPANWPPPEGWEALPECKPPPLRAPPEKLSGEEYRATLTADKAPGETRDLKTIRREMREAKTRLKEFSQELCGLEPGKVADDQPPKPRPHRRRRW